MPLSLRFTENEEKLIRDYAELKNQSVSEAVRSAILRQIEDEFDLIAFDKAKAEFEKNPNQTTLSEIKSELGIL